MRKKGDIQQICLYISYLCKDKKGCIYSNKCVALGDYKGKHTQTKIENPRHIQNIVHQSSTHCFTCIQPLVYTYLF